VEVDLLGEVDCRVAALSLEEVEDYRVEVEDYREGVDCQEEAEAVWGQLGHLLLGLLFVHHRYKLYLN
jgi:hypothetical protein